MEHRGESSYTFRQWSRDLLLWTIANDMEPHRQAALILGQLRGAAASLTREIPINVIMNGGIINGQPADPTTYILHVLGERYAQLGEETRLRVMTDLMMFEKRRNERIDDLLTRFDVIRQRVAGQGGVINMNYEGLSWLLLRACQPNDQQLLMLLQEFQGRYPNTEAQFRIMTNTLRRMGHILENSPDNIAQQLRQQQGHQGMYMANGWWGTPTNQPPSNPAQPAYHQQQPYWGNQSAPWSDNSWTGNQWSGDGWSQPPPAYNSWSQPAYQSTAMDSETDTDTESSLGDTQYDFSDLAPHLTDEQRAESIFWASQRAKGKWRRFMNKPHRRVRRHMKRKGKGKGKHPGLYLQSLTDYEVDEMFFGNKKGKGRFGKRSSGKGKGRRQNPRGPDGQLMKCRTCGSTEHFQKDCPNNKGGGAPAPFHAHYSVNQSEDNDTTGPLTDIFPSTSLSGTHSVFMMNSSARSTASSHEGNQMYDNQSHSSLGDPWHRNDPWTHPPGPPVSYGPSRTSETPSSQAQPWGTWMTDFLRGPQPQEQQRPLLNTPTLPTMGPRERSTDRTTAEWLNQRTTVLPDVHMEQADLPPLEPLRTQPQLTVGHTDRRIPQWIHLPDMEHVQGFVGQQQENFPVPPLLRTEAYTMEQNHEQLLTDAVIARKKHTEALPVRNLETTADERTIVEEYHNVVSILKTKRQATKKEQIRKLRVKLAALDGQHGKASSSTFSGETTSCAICLDDFEHGEECVRLNCRHIIHSSCMTEYTCMVLKDAPADDTRTTADCPQCRGRGDILATYRYVGLNQFQCTGTGTEGAESPATARSQDSRARSASPTVEQPRPSNAPTPRSDTPNLARPWTLPSSFPWWPEAHLPGSEQMFHASTRLTDGRHGLLVDPGAWNNLAGEKWIKEVARKAIEHGHHPKQNRMKQPVTVQGVGQGTNSANWEIQMPIAVRDSDGNTKLHEFRTPSVGEGGYELPALLGLESMSKNRAVLEMTDGQEYLTYPGPGGYKIEWSPGTRRYKLERAPSGHLILPCDAFSQLTVVAGGVRETTEQWHATTTATTVTPVVEEEQSTDSTPALHSSL